MPSFEKPPISNFELNMQGIWGGPNWRENMRRDVRNDLPHRDEYSKKDYTRHKLGANFSKQLPREDFNEICRIIDETVREAWREQERN